MGAAKKAAVYVTVGGVTYAPGEEVPAEAAGDVNAPGVFEGEGGSRYDEMKVADLRSEIESRNAGRDESARVPAEGTKADLVAALQADDGK